MNSVFAAISLVLGLKKPLKIDTSTNQDKAAYIQIYEEIPTPKSSNSKIDRSFSFSMDRTTINHKPLPSPAQESYDSEDDS